MLVIHSSFDGILVHTYHMIIVFILVLLLPASLGEKKSRYWYSSPRNRGLSASESLVKTNGTTIGEDTNMSLSLVPATGSWYGFTKSSSDDIVAPSDSPTPDDPEAGGWDVFTTSSSSADNVSPSEYPTEIPSTMTFESKNDDIFVSLIANHTSSNVAPSEYPMEINVIDGSHTANHTNSTQTSVSSPAMPTLRPSKNVSVASVLQLNGNSTIGSVSSTAVGNVRSPSPQEIFFNFYYAFVAFSGVCFLFGGAWLLARLGTGIETYGEGDGAIEDEYNKAERGDFQTTKGINA